jgi:flotillin
MVVMVVALYGVLVVLFLVIVILVQIAIYASRYKKVPPNKAMVVYGRRMMNGKGYVIVTGGGKFIMPIIEEYAFLPLDVRTLELDLDNVAVDTAGGPRKARVKATAMFKISSEPAALDAAAEHLLGKPDAEIEGIARTIIEGALRGLLSSMAFEKVGPDRDAIALGIQQRAGSDLMGMGLEVRSFVFKELALKG